MRVLLVLNFSALIFAGCVHSERIAFYRPHGDGKIVRDSRQVPRMIEYQFGAGSRLVVGSRRKPEHTEITFRMTLTEPLQFEANRIRVTCDGHTIDLEPNPWSEGRVKDGEGYTTHHTWNATLRRRDYDAAREEPPAATVQPTNIIPGASLRLASGVNLRWNFRGH